MPHQEDSPLGIGDIETDFDSARSILETPLSVVIDDSFPISTPKELLQLAQSEIDLLTQVISEGNLADRGFPEPPSEFEHKRSQYRAFADAAVHFGTQGHLARATRWSNQARGLTSEQPPEDKYNRRRWFAKIANLINTRPYLLMSQVFELCNFGPGGYYPDGHGIGRVSADGRLVSAFSTPSEHIPQYPGAYAALAQRAFERLDSVRPFTPDDPFTIILFGDGEGRITQYIQRMIDENQLGEFVRIIIADLSESLLTHQQEVSIPGLRSMFANWDARNIGALLSRYHEPRGVIIAGEELVDVFSPIVAGMHKNQIHEMAFDLSQDGMPRPLAVPLDISEYGLFIKGILKTFPHYRTLIEKGFEQEDHGFPINLGFIQMMTGIAESGFRGYWLMGDYFGGSFGHYQNRNLQRKIIHDFPPVRTYSRIAPAEPFLVINAFDAVSDATGDVDPALLRIGYSLGMRKEFLGRPAHFIDAAYDKPSLTQSQTKHLIKRIGNVIRSGMHMHSTGYLVSALSRAEDLLTSRFNFIGSFGDPEVVPPLFDTPPQEW